MRSHRFGILRRISKRIFLRFWRTRGLRFLTIFFALILVIFFWRWNDFFEQHSKLVPRHGGTLTQYTTGKIENLNPLSWEKSVLDRDIQGLIFSSIGRYNPHTGIVEPELGKWSTVDNQTFKVKIFPDARFSDGSRVTAQDVLFTYQEVLQNPDFSNESLKKALEYIEISIDNQGHSITFVAPERNTFFTTFFTIPILPAAYFEGSTVHDVVDPFFRFNREPVGAGPFVVDKISPTTEFPTVIELIANPHYIRGEPYLESLIIKAYPIDTLSMPSNQIAFFSRLNFPQASGLEKTLFPTHQKKIITIPRYAAAFFNLDRPVVERKYFRQALHTATDKGEMLESEPGWRRLDSILSFSGIETQYQKKDFKKARSFMHDAGLIYNRSQEIRTVGKNGDIVRIKIVTTDTPAIYSRMANKLAQTWQRELDIETDVIVVSPEEFPRILQTRDYDVLVFGQDISHAQNSLSVWHSSNTGKQNLSNLTNQKFDQLIEEIKFSGSLTDTFQISKTFDDLVPAILLGTPEYTFFVPRVLNGVTTPPKTPDDTGEQFNRIQRLSDIYFEVNKWYFYQKRVWDLIENKWLAYTKWRFGGQ